MVVDQNHRSRVVVNGVLKHFPWVNSSTVDGAPEQLIEDNELVPVVRKRSFHDVVDLFHIA